MYEAADIGTAIHSHCHFINTDQPPDYIPEEFEPIIAAYGDWFNATIKEVINAEELVISYKYRYAGRVDMLAIIKGDKLPTVIDIKTSRDIYPSMGLQLAGYQQGYKEAGIKANRRMIVHLDKILKGKVKTKEYRDHAKDLTMFLYALELYKYFEGGKTNDRTDIIKVG